MNRISFCSTGNPFDRWGNATMSRKPKKILSLLGLLTLPLLIGFGWWWSQIPGKTLTSFIEALKKGEVEKVNSLLSPKFSYEQEGEKLGFLGFKEKSPKRKLKVWQKALEKELNYSKREFTVPQLHCRNE